MPTSTNSIDEITLQVDSEAAKVYKSADPDVQKKIQILFGAWLREVVSQETPPLKQLMDEISDKATFRGLTQDILEAILKESVFSSSGKSGSFQRSF